MSRRQYMKVSRGTIAAIEIAHDVIALTLLQEEIEMSEEDIERKRFLSLIGSVRANGAFPDEPLLKIYDEQAQEIERLRKILAGEATVERVTMEPGGPMEIILKHPLVRVMTESMVAFFIEAGGLNYVETKLIHSASGEEYIMTVQRSSGKTPHAMRKEAEDQLASLAKQYADSTAVEGCQAKKIAALEQERDKAIGALAGTAKAEVWLEMASGVVRSENYTLTHALAQARGLVNDMQRLVDSGVTNADKVGAMRLYLERILVHSPALAVPAAGGGDGLEETAEAGQAVMAELRAAAPAPTPKMEEEEPKA